MLSSENTKSKVPQMCFTTILHRNVRFDQWSALPLNVPLLMCSETFGNHHNFRTCCIHANREKAPPPLKECAPAHKSVFIQTHTHTHAHKL